MKEEKKLLLREVEEKITASQGFILLRYLGFTAAHSRSFRNNLSGVSAEFEVLKKKIFFKALESSGVEMDPEDSEGHLGVVFAYGDPVSAAKQVLDFNKQHNDSLVFLAGRIDNASLSGKEVEAVAKLPSMKELRQQVVGLIAAPMSQVVGIMNSVLSGVISCVDQKAEKLKSSVNILKNKGDKVTTESLETLVEQLSGLTVLELSQLKKMLEEKWDVTAAAPVVAVAGAAAAGDAPASAEPTEFAVILEDVPADKKIGVLKVVREVTGLALKEAKEMTEGLPKTVKEKTSKSDAEDTVKKLQEAGAKAVAKGL